MEYGSVRSSFSHHSPELIFSHIASYPQNLALEGTKEDRILHGLQLIEGGVVKMQKEILVGESFRKIRTANSNIF